MAATPKTFLSQFRKTGEFAPLRELIAWLKARKDPRATSLLRSVNRYEKAVHYFAAAGANGRRNKGRRAPSDQIAAWFRWLDRSLRGIGFAIDWKPGELRKLSIKVGCRMLREKRAANECHAILFDNKLDQIDERWCTSTVLEMIEACKAGNGRLPILGDALQDAGCDDTELLAYCYGRK